MLTVLMGLMACSSTPTVQGTVMDVWNNPIEGAMVQMEGEGSSQSTNANGEFSFTLTDVESGNLRFRAGHKGFIHDVEVLVYSPELDDDTVDSVSFSLYPKPESKGFFAIGQSEYSHLSGAELVEFSSTFKKIYGLARVSDVKIPNKKPVFVYHSSLRKEEIKQVNLGVYKLAFKEKEEMTSFLGDTEVEIDLWVAEGKALPFNLRSLDQEDMYLVEFSEELDTGVYAFSGRYIEGKSATNTLPKELQVAYTFEIK
jgi:hypothetical protein